jgi:hypothetical protein
MPPRATRSNTRSAASAATLAGKAKASAKKKKAVDDEDDEFLPDKHKSSGEDSAKNEAEELDDDWDSASEQVKGKGKATKKSGTKRRFVLGESKTPKKRRVATAHTSVSEDDIEEPSATIDGLADLGLEDVAVEIGEASTPILNRFIQFVRDNDIKSTTAPEYTPQLDVISFVLDLPELRQWRLLVHKVALYDHEQPDGTIVRAWRVQAVDDNNPDPNQVPVDLFTLHANIGARDRCPPCKRGKEACRGKGPGQACEQCTKIGAVAAQECIRRCIVAQDHGPNYITEKVCSVLEKDKVIQLGQLKVDIMNRVPFSFDVARWKKIHFSGYTPASFPLDRQLIDSISLILWKKLYNPTLDLGSLEFIQYGETTSIWSKWYCPNRQNDSYSVPTNVYQKYSIGAVVMNKAGDLEELTRSYKITIPYKGYDESKVDALPDLRTDGYHVFETKHRDSTNAGMRAACRVLEHIMFTLVGLVGTSVAFRNKIFDERRLFFPVEMLEQEGGIVQMSRTGPYKNKTFWRRPVTLKNYPGSVLKVAPTPLQDLSSNKSDLPETALCVDTLIRDRACQAFIMQTSLNSLAAGRSLLKSIFQAHKTAQYLELGIITKTDALEQHCTCTNRADRAQTEHFCMTCHKIDVCAVMVKQNVAEGTLTLCCSCSSRNASASTQRPVSNDCSDYIPRRVTDIYRMDAAHHEPNWKKQEMIDFLIENHVKSDNKSFWYDSYRGDYISLSTRKWPSDANIDLCMANRHPYSMSIDKPHTRVLLADGTVALHDTTNVCLTMTCINLVKGADPPAVLPLLKKALQLKQVAASGRVRADYAPEISDDWEILDRVSGHNRTCVSLY